MMTIRTRCNHHHAAPASASSEEIALAREEYFADKNSVDILLTTSLNGLELSRPEEEGGMDPNKVDPTKVDPIKVDPTKVMQQQLLT